MTDPQNPVPEVPQASQPVTPPPAAQPYAAAPPPAPAYAQPQPQTVPGRTMGIVAFVLSLLLSGLAIIPLILGIVALVQSRKAGRGNGWAVAAIIISVIAIIVSIVVFFALILPSISAASTCVADPNAIVTVWGVQVPCSEILKK